MPLALLTDGKLHTFGCSKANLMFMASEPQRAIFALRPHWFIDPEAVQRWNLQPDQAANLHRMTPAGVLCNLKQFLPVDQDGVPWSPQGEALPNAAWLTRVFRYLAAERALAEPANLEIFRTLALVPDQFGRLHRPGRSSTPLWPVPRQDGPPGLTHVLSAFRVPLVRGAAGVSSALRAAVQHAVDPVVWSVTGPNLVDAISETVGEWDEKARTYRPEIHDVLLNFLASEEPSRYSDEQAERLRGVKVFPTLGKDLVTLADTDAMLPADKQFPAVRGTVLLKLGRKPSWRGLLRRLGVLTLNRQAFAERILEQDFAALPADRRYKLLAWLRDNLDGVLADAAAHRDALLNRLGRAELVQGEDGRLHAAAALYDREALIAREVLGSLAVYPDFERAYASDTDQWQAFFRRLGSPVTVKPEHVLGYVDELIGRAAAAGPDAVESRLLAVFGYVRDQWGTLAAQTVRDPASGTGAPFKNALAARAWLPARRTPERLQIFAGYVVPENRLYSPGELYEVNLGHLVASRAPLAPFPQLARDVREGLGLPIAPPMDLVLDHFEHLLDLWESEDHGGLSPTKLATSLKAIYRELGNRLAGGDADLGLRTAEARGARERLQSRIITQFTGRPCLWDGARQRFWLPAHAFAERVPFFGEARATLAFDDGQIDAAYRILGRHPTVGAEDLRSFLTEYAATYAGQALPEAKRANVLLVLRRLAEENRRPGTAAGPCPLLSEDGRLLPAFVLFEDDDPYHRPYLDQGGIHLVHRGVPIDLCRTTGVASLHSLLEERMAGEPHVAGDEALAAECRQVATTLHSNDFRRGIQRLLRHRRAEGEDWDLTWLRRLEIIPTEPFDLELWLPGEQERRVGSMDGSFFFAAGTERVYVAADSGDFVREYLASAIDHRLGGVLGNLSPVVRMLGSEPGQIETLLTKLKIPRMRDDVPQQDEHEPAVDAEAWTIFAPDAAEEEAGLGTDFHVFSDPAPEFEDWEKGSGIPGAEDEEEIASGSGSVNEDETAGVPTPEALEEPAEVLYSQDRTEVAESAEVPGAGSKPQGNAAPVGAVEPPGGLRLPSSPPQASSRPVMGGRSSAPSRRPPSGRPVREGFQPPAPAPPAEPTPVANGAMESATERHRLRSAGSQGGGSWRSRVITYLRTSTGGTRDPRDANNDELQENRHIGDAAEAFACAEERRVIGRVVTRMAHNNPGFDIRSTGADGEDRFIEVKGIKGEWDGAGVPLSARQFEKAWREREAFWVYVVEFALDPERRRLTRIQDPVGKLTEYRLDYHWRQFGA